MQAGSIVIGMLAASVLLVALAGCAGASGGPAPGTTDDAALPTALPATVAEVRVDAYVLQVDDEPPTLCLGPFMESYPPQCDGPDIVGWDWETVEDEQTASGVTWGGTYAMQGDWDGERFTITRAPVLTEGAQPIPDPDAFDPLDPALPEGPLAEGDAAAVQSELEAVPGYASSAWFNGRLVVEVRFDDGTLHDAVDARYGADAVVVRSQLRPVGGD